MRKPVNGTSRFLRTAVVVLLAISVFLTGCSKVSTNQGSTNPHSADSGQPATQPSTSSAPSENTSTGSTSTDSTTATNTSTGSSSDPFAVVPEPVLAPRKVYAAGA